MVLARIAPKHMPCVVIRGRRVNPPGHAAPGAALSFHEGGHKIEDRIRDIRARIPLPLMVVGQALDWGIGIRHGLCPRTVDRFYQTR